MVQNLHHSMEEMKMIFSLQKNKVVWEEKIGGRIFCRENGKGLCCRQKAGAGSECGQGNGADVCLREI